MTKTFRSLPPSLARRASRALGALAVLLAVCPGAAQALPLISEVLYDAAGSDDGRLFVELSGVPGTSLDGFTLEGVNGGDGAVGPVLVLTGVIGADGLFVIADRTAAGVTEIPGADLLLNFDLQNGPDSLVLTDGAQAIDAVGYGVFAVGEIFAGEGSPAEDPAAGFSIARRFADVDSGDNAADFESLALPTPGMASFQSVPEPGSAVLAGAALGTLGWLRRGRRAGTV